MPKSKFKRSHIDLAISLIRKWVNPKLTWDSFVEEFNNVANTDFKKITFQKKLEITHEFSKQKEILREHLTKYKSSSDIVNHVSKLEAEIKVLRKYNSELLILNENYARLAVLHGARIDQTNIDISINQNKATQ
tara:strand:+ start:399 stop:800 length:402 start_codon:yes stop_codon:yes gene_type:complete